MCLGRKAPPGVEICAGTTNRPRAQSDTRDSREEQDGEVRTALKALVAEDNTVKGLPGNNVPGCQLWWHVFQRADV